MSSDSSVIQVRGVSKAFDIYSRPQDRLLQMVLPKFRSALGLGERSYHQKFWALNDVSFEIEKGQTVGIIGQNGSGKSTLLQIIAGTMTPSAGTVVKTGRVAALLELGSGFNPEFTGRENVYMNAGLLGLTEEETDAKFDYIAGFADIGGHLDQPVKTYSSGMALRLAFAVQIAVESEILIIDEALAVGDARFQLKCFRRLEEIKASGTTILFVSHATELVRSFCDYGLLLDKGRAIYWGDAKTATIKYLDLLFPEKREVVAETKAATSNMVPSHSENQGETAPITVDVAGAQAQIFGVGGANLDWLNIQGLDRPNLLVGGRRVSIRCQFSWEIDFVESLILSDGYNQTITIGVAIANNKGSYIFGCNGFDRGLEIDCLQKGHSAVEFQMEMPYLAEGDYFLTVAIALGNQKNHIQLRWYDCLMQLKSLMTDKNVYGVFAIDYEMKQIA